ncbi:hypothetical protein JW960_10945 [candidate division KSB1 bacterium]|nr:hypothetical protein [candidate division KSB1 bacterium]
MILRKIILSLSLALVMAIPAFAKVGDWTTYTNKSNIYDIDYADGKLWCVSNGGVFSISLEDSSYAEYTNTSGLSSIDVRTIEIDHRGNVWVGMYDGYINKFVPATRTWETVDEYKGHVIYDIESYGDSLFIALEMGISLYNIRREEVKETYKNLGKGFPVEIQINDIYIHGKDIWAGTNYGIAKSNLNIVNLMAPESWTNYTRTDNNLISNTVQTIVGVGDYIFAGMDVGVQRFNGSGWDVWTTNMNVTALIAHGDTMYSGTKDGVYIYDADGRRLLGEKFKNIASLVVDDNGQLWAGRLKNDAELSEGYSKYDAVNNTWEHFLPPGPASNSFKCLAFDLNGVLWAGTNNGIVKYDGASWTKISLKDMGYKDSGIMAVKVDRYNTKWIGSHGAGLVKIDPDENITVYGSGYLSGIANDPLYVPVTNVAIDSRDNVWCIVYNASDGKVLAALTPEGQWQYFSTSDGIITNSARELYGLTVDNYDRIWVGSRSGVTVVDYNGTLMDKSDDIYGTLTTVDGLTNNDVRSLADDDDGIMWLGTQQGLNMWNGDVYEEYGVIHDNIETILVDVLNNKWFGTVGGLSVLAPDNYTWKHYTISDSRLVSNDVTAFAFDDNSGQMYIGTTNGLSVLQTPYSKPQANMDSLKAGPNPYFPDRGDDFTIYGLAVKASVKILTPNGTLIRSVSKDDVNGFFAWDGRDDSGQFVASGVYVFVIYSEETGESKVGKVAVIR